MIIQKILLPSVLVLIIISELVTYLSNYSAWSGCPYTIDLWYCIIIISLSLLIILCIFFYYASLSRRFTKNQCIIFLPILQLLNLIYVFIGTAWIIIVLSDASECVIVKQLPISKSELIFRLAIVYLYWFFTSICIVTVICNTVITALDHFNIRRDNGLSYREIESISTTVNNEAITCSICLEFIEPGVVVRVLPTCFHRFHLRCIDPWLLHNKLCPYCRNIVDPDGID